MLLLRRDGEILASIGGEAMAAGSAAGSDAKNLETLWSPAAAELLRRLVVRAIVRRGSAAAEFVDGAISYKARAFAKGPNLAICVIGAGLAEDEVNQEHLPAAGRPRHLDRRGFLKRMAESLSIASLKEQPLAVGIIQIEGLREIAQHADPAACDELIDAAVGRLPAPPAEPSSAHPSWYLGQLSDALLVCVIDSADRDVIEECAASICASLRLPIAYHDGSASLGAYAGIAILGRDGATPQTLIESARTAAVEAFRTGSSRVHFFSDTLKLRSLARIDIRREVLNAIDNRDIRLRYLGRHELQTGRLVALVGYLSWEHPLRGEVRPAEFLNIVESTGLSDALAGSMLECVREDFDSFAPQFPPAVRLSFGPLRHHILSGRFLGDLQNLVMDDVIEAGRLELRVAERTYITGQTRTWHALGGMGVQLIVDEVGRKMSSFDQLAHAPLSGLQLDRSWTTALRYDEAALKICRAAIGVAAALDLTPIATGVDDGDQRDLLLRLGCVQGLGDLYDASHLGSFAGAPPRPRETVDL